MNASEALELVRDRWQEFLDAYPEILALQHRAAEVAYAAKEAGDLETAEAAKATIRELGALAQRHNEAVLRYEQLAEFVPGLGEYPTLGAVPAVAYAAALVALAGVVIYVLGKMDAFRHVVGLLEEGKVTPAEARELLGTSGLSSVGSIVKWGAVAFMVYAVARAAGELGGAR